MPYRRISAYACPSRSKGCRETNVPGEVYQSQRHEPLKIAAPAAHDLAGVKSCGEGFGIEAAHGEKGRDAVDLGVAEILDSRERNR